MRMKTTFAIALIHILVFAPGAYALTAEVSDGFVTSLGSNEFLTEFGMVNGSITFKLGNFSWVPEEIWLIPQNINPSIFSKGLTQQTVIEIPKNVTSSTCRTAVYYNQSVGHGFKIYNTGTTTQIFSDGTFCGLAYNGTYFVFAKY